MKTLDAERIEALFITALPTLLVEGADRDDGSERERFEVAEQNADWSSSPERQRLIEAVLSGEDRRIDRAIEGLVERMSPEAAVIRQATTSQRRARQLEALGRFRAWAEQERAGRTEESRAEAYKLNRLLRRWFATVTVLMDDTSIEFVATRRPAAGELPTSAGRAEVQFDRRELSRIAPSTNTPHRKYQGWQAPEIIGALQAWAHAHGRSPTWGEWVKASEFHPQSLTVRRHFGKWSRALRKAGLKPNEPREVSRNWPWTDAEIFAALDRWVEQHGRAPTWSEWLRCAPEHPCTETVREHFGSWRTGLAAAGLLHADESNLRSGI